MHEKLSLRMAQAQFEEHQSAYDPTRVELISWSENPSVRIAVALSLGMVLGWIIKRTI
jgi:hypothetical protein